MNGLIKNTSRAELTGLYVRAYKNLHNGLFSIQHKGRVIAHVEEITLNNAGFAVQPAGRARVVATKSKVVHAFVSGTVCADIMALDSRATYNPYKAANFLDASGSPLHSAPFVTLRAGGIYL